MPQKKAAIKALRQAKKLSQRNLRVKRAIKSIIKDAQKALAEGQADKAKEAYQKLQKTVDKATKSGMLKANAANRKKSRLAKKIKSSKK